MNTPRIAGAVAALVLAVPTLAAGVKVINEDTHFAEGPVWYQGKLYYVEYDRNTIDVWDGKGNKYFATMPGCGPSAVVNTKGGEFLVTCYDNHTVGRLAADGKVLPPYDHDKDGAKFIGPNDFAPDRLGGIYFSDSGHPGEAVDGRVFYLTADGTISLVDSKLNAANGLVVSLDGNTLYVIETNLNRLLKYHIDSPGHVSGRTLFLNLDDLTGHVGHIYPDGVKIDSHGLIYIGQNPRVPTAPLAGIIFVVNADGKLLRSIKVPSSGVPNLAFSPDEKTLYVTALNQHDKPPYAGKVYAVPNE